MRAELWRDDNLPETACGLQRTSTLGFKSINDLLDYLVGKRVLDLGSGVGLFAKQAYEILFAETYIVSMNPRLSIPYFRQSHQESDNEHGYYSVYDDDNNEIRNPAIQFYESSAVAADWDDLPFAEETFDSIFATGSFLFYNGTYSDRTMESLIRTVKKNGGELRIQLCFPSSGELTAAHACAKKMGCTVFQGVDLSNPGFKRDYLIVTRGNL